VHNGGPSSATGVSLSDTLPSGVTFDSAAPSQGSCSEAGGTVGCALGTLADEGDASVEIKVITQGAGTLTGQASITSDIGDPVSSNNSANAQTTVNAAPVGYPRPKGATPLRASLVPAYAECAGPNAMHGPPLEYDSCIPPVQTSTFLTVGSPDANSRPINMSGSAVFRALVGTPSTPADEADVAITVNVTDVRLRSSLDDYAGELAGQLSLRITDRLNGLTQRDTGTAADLPFNFPVPCTPTGGTTNVGATCSLNSTADAILAGTIVEGKRTIWQMDDVVLFDGGPDGQAATPDNTLFLQQGVFVP
jgi:hypothetical protein